MDKNILKEIITANNLIEPKRLRELEALALSSDSSLISTIIQGGYIKEENLFPLMADYYGVEWQDIEKFEQLDEKCFQELPANLKKSETIVPLCKDNGYVIVAVSDLDEIEALDTYRQLTGWALKIIFASQEKIKKIREQLESGKSGLDESSLEDALVDLTDKGTDEHSLENLANEAPIIKLVNLIIMQAISEGASDIHVEPYEKYATVRYRIDGVLREVNTYPKEQFPAIISRIKIMADLNIAERRIPQDGRISIKLMNRTYDLRVATVPTLYGEAVVMRILDKESILVKLEDLGFSQDILANFHKQIRKANGVVLVTGPTGSGKTTSLYAALSGIKSVESKIITVEDPVEYNLEGITQIHVNAAVGLTFAAGLRSILRLDPDTVMVGEIRDMETADIAIRASLTGHLVFSTLHTNDATSTVTRLTDMGIKPYLISASFNAVLAQRLVRKNCEFCKTTKPLTESGAALMEATDNHGVTEVTYGAGCDECNGTGYSGRVGIHELFEITPKLRELINMESPLEVIRKQALEEGMITMQMDGARKVLDGITTAEEVHRVTQV